MDINVLKSIASQLLDPKKGILAADESTHSITDRFEKVGIPSTEETRRSFRQLLLTTPEIENYLSGVILFDETVRQKTDQGQMFVEFLQERGILPGIKVDEGIVEMPNFPGEKITVGLEGLVGRLKEYKKLGAKFAKWRAVFTIGDGIPSDTCIDENAHMLALYASFCQQENIVPIVEPEVLMDGDHTIEQCEEVTKQVLKIVFEKLSEQKVALEGILLKPNMIISGATAKMRATSSEIAKKTVETLLEVVPPQVPGIVFLSGGQSPDEATLHLSLIEHFKNLPWQISFSYGRALEQEALKMWGGNPINIKTAQKVFLNRAQQIASARSVK